MKKISIAMYSTFYGNAYKAPVISRLTIGFENKKMFEKGYGIRFLRNHSNEYGFHLSIIPMLVAYIIRKSSKYLGINDMWAYLAGEKIFGTIYKKRIANDNSNLIYVKPRPFNIIKASKKKNKYIVLESAEMHPNFTSRKVKEEREKFNISSKSIYENKYAVKEFNKAIKYADKIIVMSKESKISFINEGIDESKILQVSLGNDKVFDSQTSFYSSEKEIAFFSTAYHSILKGTHRLLLAWNQIENNTNRLFIVGGIRKDLKDFISKYGPFKNVTFTGSIKREELFNLYNKYNSVGILLSISEAYGRSVAEYISSGMPVIVSKVCTIDLIRNGINGHIVNYNNENEIKDAISSFLDSSDLYIKMNTNNLKLQIPLTDDFSNIVVREIFKEAKRNDENHYKR